MVNEAVEIRVLGAASSAQEGDGGAFRCTTTARITNQSRNFPTEDLFCGVADADCVCQGVGGDPDSTYLVEVFRDGERVFAKQVTLGKTCGTDGSCCVAETAHLTVRP